MCKIPITIDYVVIKSILIGMKFNAQSLLAWTDKMIEQLDKKAEDYQQQHNKEEKND